jgi:hypothetical protein
LVSTGAVYLLLIGSLFTDLYHPFEVGEDRSWLIFALLIAAHLALGASWKTRWSLALPPALALIGFVVALSVDNRLAAVAAVIAAPLACVLVAAGRLLARSAGRVGAGRLAPVLVPMALFVLAAVPLAEAARERHHLDTGPRLSRVDAERLPLDEFLLNSLCDQELPARARLLARERAELQAQGRALVAATRRHPDWIVRARYFSSDEDPGQHDELMTVRQLAQNQLGALRDFPACEPALKRALAKAIG